jgi:hypothetical protein
MKVQFLIKLGVLIALHVAVAPLGAAEAGKIGDPVARLQRQIDQGQTKLSYDSEHGYLSSLLKALRVPAESQGLVFSKTSFQASRISPQTPRALYFNDDVYVGWVKDGQTIELASVDPTRGPVFYLLPQRPFERPRFVRQGAACMQCHQTPQTGDVPGLLMRSVFPDRQGMPVFSAGTFVTTEQSPMTQRWGGWYLDARADGLGMGNGFVDDPTHPETLNHFTSDLSSHFDATGYPTGHSDPVALLVLAHQTHLHNLLTQAAGQTRAALAEEQAIREAMGAGPGRKHSDSTMTRIGAACEPVVKCLLFSQEATLASPVAGSSGFSREFEQLGPADHQGRSLRQFDLQRRVFKFPCSYLIYSDQFESLPEVARQYVYRRLWKVLTGRDDSREFDHLTDRDREAIYQILLQTKNDLPAYWKSRK